MKTKQELEKELDFYKNIERKNMDKCKKCSLNEDGYCTAFSCKVNLDTYITCLNYELYNAKITHSEYQETKKSYL